MITVGDYVRRIGMEDVGSVIRIGLHVEGMQVAQVMNRDSGKTFQYPVSELIRLKDYCPRCHRYEDA